MTELAAGRPPRFTKLVEINIQTKIKHPILTP